MIFTKLKVKWSFTWVIIKGGHWRLRPPFLTFFNILPLIVVIVSISRVWVIIFEEFISILGNTENFTTSNLIGKKRKIYIVLLHFYFWKFFIFFYIAEET